MTTFPVVNMQQTGLNIAALRKDKGLTVKELQMMMGFATPQAIYKWQQGVCLPTVDNLVALSSILNVTIEEILVVSA